MKKPIKTGKGVIDDAYKAYCTTRFPLPSEKEVAQLEAKIGVALPSDYREYILNYNGGFFSDPNIVPPVGCPIEDALTELSGIKATHKCAELGDNVTLFDDNFPAQILPIGYTIMGNLIFLITHPEDRGYICLKRLSSDDVYFLAEGIEDFFRLLHDPDVE